MCTIRLSNAFFYNFFCLFSRGRTRLWTVNAISIASICISQHCFFFLSRKHNPPVATFQTQQEVGKLIAAQASALMKDYLQRGNWLIELKGNFLLMSTPVMARAMQGGRKGIAENKRTEVEAARFQTEDSRAPPPCARARVSAGCSIRAAAHLQDPMNLSPIL